MREIEREIAIWAGILLGGGTGLFLIGAFSYIVFDSVRGAIAMWRVRRRYR